MRSFRAHLLARAGVLLVAIALIVAACAGPAQPTPTPPPGATPTPEETPQAGGRVIEGSFADIKVLNPVLTQDVPSATVSSRIYEGLVRGNPDTGEPEANYAESFEVSADGQTITYVLKDGLVWSDGSPLTGDDFKFMVKAVMRSQLTVRKNIFQDIVGAKEYCGPPCGTEEEPIEEAATDISGITVSGRNVTVQLARTFCPGIFSIGAFGIIPESEFGKYMDDADHTRNLDEAPENLAPILSGGAFMFREHRANDQTILVKNPNYHRGEPLLDEWVYLVRPDSTAVAAALKTGEIDYATAQPSDRDDLLASGNLVLHSYQALSYTYIGWNQLRGGKEFLQEKEIRQAMAYGLDMQTVVDEILLGEGTKMVSHHPPASWAFAEEGMEDYDFDPDRARQLIEGQGFTRGADGIYARDGERLSFSIVTNSGNRTRETLLQIAVEQYADIGVEVEPLTESFEVLVDRLTQTEDPNGGGGRDFDAVIIGWSLGLEPDAFSIWHSTQARIGGFNFVGYKNDVVDKALEDGRANCPQAQRQEAYARFNLQLNEDQPYNFGFSPNTLLFVNERVQNFRPGTFGVYHNIQEWWVRQ